MLPNPLRVSAELVALFILVATLILVPVLISASQHDKPHRQYHLKHPASEKP
jgi:hypothetical protein